MASIFDAGILGLVLLLAGWMFETYSVVKAGKTNIPLSFAALYFLGSVLLTYHAYSINDSVFLVLNVAAAIMPLISVYYIFYGKGAKKK